MNELSTKLYIKLAPLVALFYTFRRFGLIGLGVKTMALLTEAVVACTRKLYALSGRMSRRFAKSERGAEMIQIVVFVVVFVLPIGILFWYFQKDVLNKFWENQVECRFTSATCGQVSDTNSAEKARDESSAFGD